ncbi:PQQ-dependent sugar dehydrogenase [Thalassotalea sp. HSM 43]|uniref:PQQ-dependent sugar dehydrogenase n=1 Tax=Thalassotalea sp. HSM 43 TaxID=2552945 RepID=UPI001080613F|nr:PQQ-dependent sugar dehydrogenase [Thalassotalea sp. HSM 43]QBY03877.1 PQQ-dependent sugar dehydrogenase [Thalassotalea sp. HSM 43]
MKQQLAKTLVLSSMVTLLAACSASDGNSSQQSDEQNNDAQAQVKVMPTQSDVVIPWGMVQLSNDDLLISERTGKLRLIRNGVMIDEEITGLPSIVANNQGGLLDIALHPDYQQNGWIYFTFSSDKGDDEGSNTALIRARLKEFALVDLEWLYKGAENSEKGHHYGSRITFDKQGFVYFSIGDRGQRDALPQDISVDGGKIYRLHDDGRIPADNPFVNVENAKPAIFSYGHRNPQGLTTHPVTGAIWSHEHGPKGGDEINLIEPGKNYGWPVISYGVNYSGTSFTDITEKDGMEQPKLYWDPSIAPSGLIFVTSDKYPEWQNKMLLGSMKFNHLVLVTLDGDNVVKQQKLLEGIGRVRNVYQGRDGFIYVGIDGQGIKKLVPEQE